MRTLKKSKIELNIFIIALIIFSLSFFTNIKEILLSFSFSLLLFHALYHTFQTLKEEKISYNLIIILTAIYYFSIGELINANIFFLIYQIVHSLLNFYVEEVKARMKEEMKYDFIITYVVDNQFVNKSIQDLKRGDIILFKKGEKIFLQGKDIKTGRNIDFGSMAFGDVLIKSNISYNDLDLFNKGDLIKEFKNNSSFTSTFIKLEDYLKIFAIFLGIIVFFVIYLETKDSYKALNYGFILVLLFYPKVIFLSLILLNIKSNIALKKNNILLSNFDDLGKIDKIKTIVLDKSSVLLKNDLQIKKIKGDKNLLKIIANIERDIDNEIAYFLRKSYGKDLTFDIVESKRESGGVITKTKTDTYIAGNIELLQKYKVKNIVLEEEVGTVIYIAKNGMFLGDIVIRDTINKEVKAEIGRLHKLNKSVLILSGDNYPYVREIAEELNIKRYMALLDQDKKIALLKTAKKEDHKIFLVTDQKVNKELLKYPYLSGVLIKDKEKIKSLHHNITFVRDFKISALFREINNLKFNLFSNLVIDFILKLLFIIFITVGLTNIHLALTISLLSETIIIYNSSRA